MPLKIKIICLVFILPLSLFAQRYEIVSNISEEKVYTNTITNERFRLSYLTNDEGEFSVVSNLEYRILTNLTYITETTTYTHRYYSNKTAPAIIPYFSLSIPGESVAQQRSIYFSGGAVLRFVDFFDIDLGMYFDVGNILQNAYAFSANTNAQFIVPNGVNFLVSLTAQTYIHPSKGEGLEMKIGSGLAYSRLTSDINNAYFAVFNIVPFARYAIGKKDFYYELFSLKFFLPLGREFTILPESFNSTLEGNLATFKEGFSGFFSYCVVDVFKFGFIY